MSGPYSRVYLSIVDDPRFTTVFDNDHHLATWLRLLLVAEASWPASAHIPRSAKRSSLTALSDAGLIDLNGDRYRIHGLDAEREKRRAHASASSNARWASAQSSEQCSEECSEHSPEQSSNDASTSTSTSTSTSKEESTPPTPPPGWDGDDLWRLYQGITKAARLKPSTIDWLERLETTYTAPSVAEALRMAYSFNPDPSTLLSRTESSLLASAKRAEAAAEKAKRSDRIVSGMVARRLETYRNTGKWDAAWGPVPE